MTKKTTADKAPDGPAEGLNPEVAPVAAPELALTPAVPSVRDTAGIMARPLYDIADEYVALVDYLTERGGEMDEDSIVAWDGIRGTVAEKLENCALMITALGSLGDLITDEAKRLRERAGEVTSRRDKLKEYVRRQMERMEIKKSEGPRMSVRRQINPPGCTVYDLDQVPPEFTDVTITMTGTGWNNLLAILKTIIPDPTKSELATDHWGGVWKVDRRVRSREIIEAWKKTGGVEDVPGTKVEQSESLRVW